MFSRVSVIFIAAITLLFPATPCAIRPVILAQDVSEVRTLPSGIYSQGHDEPQPSESQKRLALPASSARRGTSARRLADVERLSLDASVVAVAMGRTSSVARIRLFTAGQEIAHEPSAVAVQKSAMVVSCTVTARADSGPGSLRQCLLQAAANGTILFDPGVFPPASPATITLASALPVITVDNLVLDGSNAGVVLDGSGLTGEEGLVIYGADGVVIRGLQILHFRLGVVVVGGARHSVIGGDRSIGTAPLGQGNLIGGNTVGVLLQGEGTEDNQVLGNYIGTDLTGAQANGNSEDGILIRSGASNNIVGGETPNTRNLIGGNTQMGVRLQDEGTTGNRIQGNTIGADITGTRAVANQQAGIMIGYGASDNLVGGSTPDERNLVSGNGEAGVWLEGSGAANNQIQGNYIGSDVTGAKAVLNGGHGVFLGFEVNDNVVGGLQPGQGNLISGNGEAGVQLQNAGTAGNAILGNLIGTDATGMLALGNGEVGVAIIAGASNNMVGNGAAAGRNLISANDGSGLTVEKAGSQGNRIMGNYIGTNIQGTGALGNGTAGAAIAFGASDNTIGGDTPGSGNLISGNLRYGIVVQSMGSVRNRVQGNYVGTDVTGNAALGNGDVGVLIMDGAADNLIGGVTANARNVISGNLDLGIHLQDPGTARNQIAGNYVGVDSTGMRPLGNSLAGIVVASGATDNMIGGEAPGAGNVISANGWSGVQFQNLPTTGNVVAGNLIGTDAAGTGRLGNGEDGVIFLGGSGNRVGGSSPAARNVLSGNGDAGIWIQEPVSSSNLVLGNYIGVDATGAKALGNAGEGVVMLSGAHHNTIGGLTTQEHNIIGGNGGHGVALTDEGTTGNAVQGNYIGAGGVDGSARVPNLEAGVFLGNGTSANTIGISNTIAYNGSAGAIVAGELTVDNTLTRNLIYANGGPAIQLIDLERPAPVIAHYNRADQTLLGEACPGCRVEIYANPNSQPGGTIFLAEAVSGSTGSFQVAVPMIGVSERPPWPYLSATATDLDGTTSAFCAGFLIGSRFYVPLVLR